MIIHGRRDLLLLVDGWLLIVPLQSLSFLRGAAAAVSKQGFSCKSVSKQIAGRVHTLTRAHQHHWYSPRPISHPVPLPWSWWYAIVRMEKRTWTDISARGSQCSATSIALVHKEEKLSRTRRDRKDVLCSVMCSTHRHQDGAWRTGF